MMMCDPIGNTRHTLLPCLVSLCCVAVTSKSPSINNTLQRLQALKRLLAQGKRQ